MHTHRHLARLAALVLAVAAALGVAAPVARAAATLSVTIAAVQTPLLSGQLGQWRVQYECSSVDPAQTECQNAQIRVSVPVTLPAMSLPYVVFDSVGDAFWNKAATPTGGPLWEWVFTPKTGSVPVGTNGTLHVQVTPPDWWTPNGLSMDASAVFSSSNAGTVTDGPAAVVYTSTPAIAIDKFDPGSVVRDVPVTYTIWGTGWGLNGGFGLTGMPFGTGHLTLGDATIVDTLPPGAVYVSSNPPGQFDAAANTVTWSTPVDTRAVQVTVTYPSADFAITDTVTNRVVITGHPLGDPVTELVARDSVTHSFAEFVPGSSYTKEVARATLTRPALLTQARAPFVTEGLGGFFWFHTVRNTGNGPIGGVIEDVMPCPVVSPASASPVCATPGFHLHSFGFTVGPAPVQIDWVASDGSSGSYAVTASDVAAAVVLAGALGMPPGTELASFRAVYAETIPAGTSTQLLVNGNLTNAFPANTYTQTNCGSFRMTAAGTTYPPGGLQCPVAAFRDPRIVWGSSKWAESRSGGYFTFPNVTNLQPGQGIIWRLTATNWGEVASTPQIVDLLPASLDYDPSVPVTAYVHPLNPGTLKPLSGVSVIATPDYNGTGRTLLRVVFPPGFTVPAYSSTADISVSVWVGTSIRAGTTIGSYTNEAQVYDAGGAFGCVNDWSVADLDNLSGLGTDLRLCPGAATFTVAASANAGARKLVKGDRDADFLAGVGQSLAGGSSQWQISVGNYGNSTPLTDVVAYDIFPYVGDTGVSAGQVGVPRLSQFAPTLQDPVNAPAGVTISYSQSTNPCRPELIPTGPAGCVDDWTTTFPGPGLAKAIRIDGGSTVLAPGQLITVTYPMALPATADGGQIAWNSVAFRATRTDDGQPSLPTEPSKVGIQIVSASIGDVVWLDVDRDGRQGDPAVERPLGAVPVNLYAADGVTMLDSVTTGANGYYSFLGLTAGRDYVVEFGRLPGMGFTIAHAGADGSDSDADPGTGRVTVTAPTTGGANLPSDGAGQWADDPSIDAGLVGVNLTATKQLRSTGRLLPGTTVEFVVTPHNDGPTDALAGWSVTEVLPAGLTMVSMTGAGYTCAGVTCTAGDRLPAGGDGAPVTVLARIEPDAADSLRNVAYVAPAAAEVLEGRPLGSPPGPGTDTGLTDTDNDAHAELTVTPLVSVGDFVWLDVDRDGVQDDGEPPVPGVVVHLLDAEGTVVAQTTTDAAGWYSFDALVPGAAYTMEFVKPAGMSLTTPDAGSSDEADSDVDPVTARVSFTAPAQATGSGTTLDDPSIDGGLVGVNLIVTKQLRSAGPWAPGASVEYLLTPRNDGPADALAGWSVTEVLPAGLTLVSMTGTGYTCTGATCTAGDRLPAGATGAPITVTATLGTAVTGTVRNVAFVSPAPSDVAETNPLAAPPGADADTGASATDNDAHADLVVATPLVVTTDLAQTGAELARILLLGVGLVGAGALLRLRSRRRRGTGVAGA